MLLLLLCSSSSGASKSASSRARAAGAAIVRTLVYTIPLNLYPVAAIMTCQGAFLIAHLRAPVVARASDRAWRPPRDHPPCAAGVALAALLFIPLYGSMARSPYLRPYTNSTPASWPRCAGRDPLLSLGTLGAAAGRPVRITALAGTPVQTDAPALLKKYLLLSPCCCSRFSSASSARPRLRADLRRPGPRCGAVPRACTAASPSAFSSRPARRSASRSSPGSGRTARRSSRPKSREGPFPPREGQCAPERARWDTLYGGLYQAGCRPRRSSG